MLEPEEVEEKTGTGEIMKVFKIHRMGNIAGVQTLRWLRGKVWFCTHILEMAHSFSKERWKL